MIICSESLNEASEIIKLAWVRQEEALRTCSSWVKDVFFSQDTNNKAPALRCNFLIFSILPSEAIEDKYERKLTLQHTCPSANWIKLVISSGKSWLYARPVANYFLLQYRTKEMNRKATCSTFASFVSCEEKNWQLWIELDMKDEAWDFWLTCALLQHQVHKKWWISDQYNEIRR